MPERVDARSLHSQHWTEHNTEQPYPTGTRNEDTTEFLKRNTQNLRVASREEENTIS